MSGQIKVRAADPHETCATALLRASHTLMQALYPPEHNFYLEIDELARPGIRFIVAEVGGKALGCTALALREGYGEIKSMFVDPGARGLGVGGALMAELDRIAKTEGLQILRLETGDTLDAAQRLYARNGFNICGPFGDYTEGPHSVFMEKRLG